MTLLVAPDVSLSPGFGLISLRFGNTLPSNVLNGHAATMETYSTRTGETDRRCSAVPLILKLSVDNPFRGVDFFETDDGGLVIGG